MNLKGCPVATVNPDWQWQACKLQPIFPTVFYLFPLYFVTAALYQYIAPQWKDYYYYNIPSLYSHQIQVRRKKSCPVKSAETSFCLPWNLVCGLLARMIWKCYLMPCCCKAINENHCLITAVTYWNHSFWSFWCLRYLTGVGKCSIACDSVLDNELGCSVGLSRLYSCGINCALGKTKARFSYERLPGLCCVLVWSTTSTKRVLLKVSMFP